MIKLSADILNRAHELESQMPNAMVAVFSPDGGYLYASPNHRRIIGYTAAELSGMKLPQIVAPADLEHTRLGFMDTILHGKSVIISVDLIAKSGHPVPVKAEAWHAADPESGQGFIIGRAAPAEPGKTA